MRYRNVQNLENDHETMRDDKRLIRNDDIIVIILIINNIRV